PGGSTAAGRCAAARKAAASARAHRHGSPLAEPARARATLRRAALSDAARGGGSGASARAPVRFGDRAACAEREAGQQREEVGGTKSDLAGHGVPTEMGAEPRE